MRLHHIVFALAALLFAVPRAAASEKTGVWQHPERTNSEEAEAEARPRDTAPAERPAPRRTGGGLTVRYATPTDDAHTDLAAALEESRGLDIIVQGVNETYDFPAIDVVFDECDQANAFYSGEERRIILCYELVATLMKAFREDEDLSEQEVWNQVVATLIFTFFHELGHAAVDVFDIPITGNEEDAVDRFATLILLSAGTDEEDEDDFDLADNAIGSFDLDIPETLDDLDFADEHPVDEQRWYTMACLMVGSDPAKYGYLVGDDGLPSERAEGCAEEFERISKGWETLMAKHLRKT